MIKYKNQCNKCESFMVAYEIENEWGYFCPICDESKLIELNDRREK